jgi:hypothetical protein
MRNFVCPTCGKKILEEYVPDKSWFVFGTKNGGIDIDDCGIHEVIKEFDTQEEAIDYISDSPCFHEARYVSDDVQK